MLTYQLQEVRTRRAIEEKERIKSMRVLIGFGIGFFFGALFGVVLTAVLVAHRDEDDML